jgi:hypothetical protein
MSFHFTINKYCFLHKSAKYGFIKAFLKERVGLFGSMGRTL